MASSLSARPARQREAAYAAIHAVGLAPSLVTREDWRHLLCEAALVRYIESTSSGRKRRATAICHARGVECSTAIDICNRKDHTLGCAKNMKTMDRNEQCNPTLRDRF
jgi:hypothetical protein